jgi:glycosyltransferase involved in cell wall biosynthesis
MDTASSGDSADEFSPAPRPRVAYMMSRFPKLTETFVLDEILELERRGVEVEVFPLWREKAEVIHPEARPVVERARFTKTLDARILVDVARCFASHPWRFVSTLATLIWANRASPRFLLGALAIFPKSCHFAVRMRSLGVRHLHAHFASHPAAAAFIVGRFSGIPYSFTAHGSDLHREQSMLREKVAESKFVVAISEYNRRFILDHVGEALADRIEVVHCGVDPAAYPERVPESGPLRIVCTGTLHPVKGQRYLIDACAQLTSEDIDWRCELIGDGEDRKDLEAQAQRLGIADRVVFHGHCRREQVREILSRADVVAAPSVPTRDGRREGIPVALMEAAACGLPLVASRLSGIPELVVEGETGLLAEPGDVEGLAAALAQLAREPETRARLGAGARKRIEEDFSLSANGLRLRQLMLGDASRGRI